MFPRITQVRHIRDFRLALTFVDGTQVEMDFSNKLKGRGGVFAPLHDVEFFRQVRIDTVAGTLAWPNDVDLDPDVLYCEATGTPLPMPEPASVR